MFTLKCIDLWHKTATHFPNCRANWSKLSSILLRICRTLIAMTSNPKQQSSLKIVKSYSHKHITVWEKQVVNYCICLIYNNIIIRGFINSSFQAADWSNQRMLEGGQCPAALYAILRVLLTDHLCLL